MKIHALLTFLLAAGSIVAPPLVDNNVITLTILAICYGGLTTYLASVSAKPSTGHDGEQKYGWRIGVVVAFIVYAIFQLIMVILFYLLQEFGLGSVEPTVRSTLIQGLLASASIITCLFCLLLGMLWLSKGRSVLLSALAFGITMLLIVVIAQTLAIIAGNQGHLALFDGFDLPTILQGGAMTLALYTFAVLVGAWFQQGVDWALGKLQH